MNKITDTSIVDRDSNDAFFILQAESQAELSKCLKIKVGAVLVKDDIIIGQGFNAVPLKHICTECKVLENGHCSIASHAEAEAIIKALQNEKEPEGSTLYCTHFPCVNCSALLKKSGVSRLVYKHDYNDERGDQRAYLWNIEIKQVK